MDDVVGAYARRSAEYAERLGRMEATAQPDRELVRAWALSCGGPVVDLGCGPGHWTAYLHDAGVEVHGLDPVRELVDIARAANPAVDYRVGSVADLDPGAYQGVLAWYSLIHLIPAELPGALRAIRAALRPGGRFLVGFFEGPEATPFDHAVTTAWYWPVGDMAEQLRAAGFVDESVVRRQDDGARPHAAISAVTDRRPTPSPGRW